METVSHEKPIDNTVHAIINAPGICLWKSNKVYGFWIPMHVGYKSIALVQSARKSVCQIVYSMNPNLIIKINFKWPLSQEKTELLLSSHYKLYKTIINHCPVKKDAEAMEPKM